MNVFTLMIADDEKIIRDGLQDSIDWGSLGFKLIAVASDGEEALELFREHKPQTVIMDIHMPAMNGLEVLVKLKNEQPDTEVILLSGYDEFTYAQKGIKEGAFDYIIKLNMFPELEESLKKLHQALSHRLEETKQRNQLLLLKNDYMFQEYRSGRSPLELGHAGDEDNYCVVSVWLSSPRALYADFCDRDTLPLKYLIKRDNHYIHFIFYREGEESQLFHKRLLDSIRIVEHHLDRTVYKIGIGNVKSFRSEIPLIYKEAMKTVDYLRSGDSESAERSVLFYKDWQGQEHSVNYNLVSDMHWVNWVYSGDNESLINWIRIIFAEACVSKKISVSDMKYLCIQIVAQFEKMTKEQENEAITLNEFDSLIDLEAYMIRVIEARSAIVHRRIQQKKNESIAAVKEYVDGMYMANLSLEDVAKQFYFSPGYLSSKFKEYTGMTFSKYLITKRIETACQLLVGTEMKIYEIAKEVGYSDEKHFSKLFTQSKHMGPREYRKHNRL